MGFLPKFSADSAHLDTEALRQTLKERLMASSAPQKMVVWLPDDSERYLIGIMSYHQQIITWNNPKTIQNSIFLMHKTSQNNPIPNVSPVSAMTNFEIGLLHGGWCWSFLIHIYHLSYHIVSYKYSIVPTHAYTNTSFQDVCNSLNNSSINRVWVSNPAGPRDFRCDSQAWLRTDSSHGPFRSGGFSTGDTTCSPDFEGSIGTCRNWPPRCIQWETCKKEHLFFFSGWMVELYELEIIYKTLRFNTVW